MATKQKNRLLKKDIGPIGLLLYGLGNIIGAGIYVLVGKIAERAGYLAPISFLVAGLAATLTAFSYTELIKILAVTAAEPVYAYKAFKKKFLSLTIGFAIFAAAVVSAGVLAKSFAGYFSEFVDLPTTLIVIGIVGLLTFLAVKGVKETVGTAALLTITEVIGLLIIIGSAFVFVDGFGGKLADTAAQIPSSIQMDAFAVVLSGSFLAFYAFIGFEDMMGLAEEVKKPAKSYPFAILGSIIIASVLYIVVALVSMTVISPDKLGTSDAPLADVYQSATGWQPQIITVIGIAAITNGLLAQMIMGSRMLFGLARQGWIAKDFQQVSGEGTPLLGTMVVSGLVLLAALLFPLESLAEVTSLLLLLVFCVVNASLIVLRRKRKQKLSFYNRLLPYAGIGVSLVMISTRLGEFI